MYKKIGEKDIHFYNNKMADFLFCFTKHLWNYLSKFTETLQEASLHDPLKIQQGIEIDQQQQNDQLTVLLLKKSLKLPGQIQWNYKNKTRHRHQ